MVVMDLGGGGAEPVTLAEAKTWCRIDRSDEDALITALIRAARETVERETGLVLVRRNFRVALDGVPKDRRIAARKRPVAAVSAVTAFGADGASVALAASAVTIDRFRDGGAFEVSEQAASAAAGGIEIEFAAGYEAAAVPEALKSALKRIVAASYEMRGAVAADMQPAVVPKAARDLVAPFRERRL